MTSAAGTALKHGQRLTAGDGRGITEGCCACQFEIGCGAVKVGKKPVVEDVNLVVVDTARQVVASIADVTDLECCSLPNSR